MSNIVTTEKAPKAIGPYSQAVESNGFLFCSGQIGIDPSTNSLVDGLLNQFKQSLLNIKAVLNSRGLDFVNVVKTTIFLTDISRFAQINEIYAEFFEDSRPARSTVAVASLPKNALIEIEVIAEIPAVN